MALYNDIVEDRPVCLMAADCYIPKGDLSPEYFRKIFGVAAERTIKGLDENKPDQKARIVEIQDALEFLFKLVKSAGIEMRYTCIDKYYDWCIEHDYKPSLQERSRIWRKYAPQMMDEAVNKMINNWGGDKDRIKHVIAHSVTGWDVPGLSHHIIYDLELPQNTRPIPVNYIGCQGGMTLIYCAATVARSHRDDLVLAATSETCTAHPKFFDENVVLDKSLVLPMMLFGDSAAATLFGRPNDDDIASSQRSGFGLWECCEFGAWYIPNTREVLRILISEEPGSYVENCIRPDLPVYLNAEMTKYFTTWLDRVLGCSFSEVEFACHPGGKKLLDNFAHLIEDLGVPDGKKAIEHCTTNIVRYGNLASSAILVILADLCRKSEKNHLFCMGMGPGISIEYGGLKRWDGKSRGIHAATVPGTVNGLVMFLMAVIAGLVAMIVSGVTFEELLA